MHKILNFNAGPAVLPEAVLKQVQAELRDFRGTGLSVLEVSHRGKEFEAVLAEAEAALKRLLGVNEGYRVVFMQGGASSQFAMVPMNFLPPGGSADYLVHGTWGEKAVEEAVALGQARVAGSTKDDGYVRVPRPDEIHLSADAAFVHLTSNETIQGVQWPSFPDVGARPLVADMSSDLLCRPIDGGRFAMIYAGAQKNLGPAGVTVALLRESWLARANAKVPTMFRYATFVKNNSLYNTPPVFAIYVVGLVLKWVEELGGLDAMAKRNAAKAALIYGAIDQSGGYFRGHAAKECRSSMNATWRLPDAAKEKAFLAEAQAAGMVGLAGHRSVGGLRASMYNAMDAAGCQTLAEFMKEFARRHG